jgi:hypothetical protein
MWDDGFGYNLIINILIKKRIIQTKLTPWSRVLLEKLINAKIFPVFYGTPRFSTVFTKALDWYLFGAG